MANKIILSESDYLLLTGYIRNNSGALSSYTLSKLNKEIDNAKVVKPEELPKDVISLNSSVQICEIAQKRTMKVQLVLPIHANMSEGKISIFAPLGTALIGYRKGDVVEWEVPAGVKKFEILEVKN